MVVLKRALCGLKTASASFHKFLGDFLREMGFTPSRADQDLWMKKSDHYDGYDYIATHVDNLIIEAKEPLRYMNHIKQHFQVRDITDTPSFYLGNDVIMNGTRLHISTKSYVKEILHKYQEKYDSLAKENLPIRPVERPELDETPTLDIEQHKEYQHIVGVCQWLIVSGRFDIMYAVSSLSRFLAAPQEGHLVLARKLFGYLKKYPKRGYAIKPNPLVLDADYEKVELKLDFGNQYGYFHEDIDEMFPYPVMNELPIYIFCDADHGHNRKTGRSITGLFSIVGSTPISWMSKRQLCVHTSTFGAEFMALKAAVKEAVMLRYHLRAMGFKVSAPTPIFVDNMSVVLNASNPGSTLNKKTVALSYHFVREHVANDVIEIRKIDSEDNFADPFTKPLVSNKFHGFFHECMVPG